MCGIVGFVDFKFRSNKQFLMQMSTCLSHRGPDGDGIYFNNTHLAQIGLGHRRLSIIDLSASSNQPMSFNGLHIIFNGEIYNFKEIKATLLLKGHEFQTKSDTEVILHSWLEYGAEVIQQWRGMFSIVLLDESKQELICIRDRAGVKPFYYSWEDGLFLFGSELKSIMAHPSFKKIIDVNAVASFLHYGYISHPHSIFKNTFKLSPGHLLRLDLKSKNIEIRQYWNVYDFYNKPKLNIGLNEAIIETERILENSFQYRMISDVPVGIFLSGGYDSSCVTSLLQNNNSEKLKTFTIGTTDRRMDEAPFANKIASFLGTDHTEYYCTSKEALEIIPDLPLYFDEPFGDSSAIPSILISKLAKSKVKVVLSADGGDEIFAGYNKYDYINRYSDKIFKIPTALREFVAATLSSVPVHTIPILKDIRNFSNKYEKFMNLLLDPSTTELLKNLNYVFGQREVEILFEEDIQRLRTAHDNLELKNEYYDNLTFAMAIDYQTYLVDDILQKVDRATMSASIEGREPFLDQNIIEWVAQLPSEFKYNKGRKKFILKEIVHRHIPKELMERPKMGFGIPLESWMKNELRHMIMESFTDESLSHGIFKKSQVQSLVSDFFNGRSEKFLKVWYLLMFQLWYKKWMT